MVTLNGSAIAFIWASRAVADFAGAGASGTSRKVTPGLAGDQNVRSPSFATGPLSRASETHSKTRLPRQG